MSVDADFSAFEEELDTPPPQIEAPTAPAFSIDDLAMDESDLPPTAPDPRDEEIRRLKAQNEAFINRPAPSAFDAPEPPKPEDIRARIRDEFKRKLESGDPDAVADAFVMAAEMGAQSAELRLKQQLVGSQAQMIDRSTERFIAEQKDKNPKLWKAIQKDFDGFMADAKKRVTSDAQALSRLTPDMVKEACEDFYERSKGRALDRYLAKSEAATKPQQRQAPPPSEEEVPDYNILSGDGGGKSKGPLVGKNDKEKRLIADARLAGLNDDDIRDIL